MSSTSVSHEIRRRECQKIMFASRKPMTRDSATATAKKTQGIAEAQAEVAALHDGGVIFQPAKCAFALFSMTDAASDMPNGTRYHSANQGTPAGGTMRPAGGR